jgi:acyl-coenzyme A thioesterase PaaI-like protein
MEAIDFQMQGIPLFQCFKNVDNLEVLPPRRLEQSRFVLAYGLTNDLVPHGGFVTAVFMQVASTHFSTTLSSQNQPHTIALHLDFLRRTQSGPATFKVKDTKLGRQTSVIHITLTQDGRDEVVGYLTNSNIKAESGVSFNTSYALNPPPLPVDFSLIKENKDENWAPIPEMPFASFRRATRKTDFYFPRQGQRKRSSADEWIRLLNGEKWTNISLGYVCDMWPMPVEAFLHDQNPYDVSTIEGGTGQLKPAKFWYPTLLLNLDVKKALPEEGVEWLFVRVEAKQIKNGRMDLEIVILDEGGDLVALSHHVAFALGAERNTAKRKTVSSKI